MKINDKFKVVATLSERLKEALELNNLSQTDFAKKMSYSRQAMSAYIKGSRTPKLPMISAMARALDVNEAWLCGYDVPKDRNMPKEQFSINKLEAALKSVGLDMSSLSNLSQNQYRLIAEIIQNMLNNNCK